MKRASAMQLIIIKGDNYAGYSARTRVACRAVTVQDGLLLLSYETQTGQWMLPGGGMEGGEDEAACCAREVLEETGVVVEPGECFLEIEELYENRRFISRYFVCRPVGKGEKHLTQREAEVGMEPRLLPVPEAAEIFGRYNDYAETDEERRGMYLREYTALRAWMEWTEYSGNR